ncbi:serine hydrolase domain-containing protein [Paenibacillus koleovorans]|uniref:serine hydrolase domain-containing protein n=1 Tax=Paenibacillus koleovorans TaxID=121608 RepID=UPI000FDA8418|nr:serine hydrolase domain-containing protein [Paenibacillus koleovorans]
MKLTRDLPENHGLSTKRLLAFFAKMEQLQLNVDTLMLLQNGQVTAEFCRVPYRLDSPRLLFSLSKSFTSIAVGIAWDSGLLGLHDPVVSFFPDKLSDLPLSSNLAKMTIHHLLSMNAGHQDNIYGPVIGSGEQDWVKAFLRQPVEHEPGHCYRYSTPATYMLSAILEQVTGQTLVDFLMPRLFEPLGICRPSWETCPGGVSAGGMGLSLSTEDVAKFGVMLQNKGKFDGKRIVSEAYLELATAEQSDNRAGATRIDDAQGYGYQLFLGRQGCYRGVGGFGQLCLVAPELGVVVVATSSFSSMAPLQTVLDLLYEHILGPLALGCVGLETVNGLDRLALQRQLSEWASSSVPVSKPVPVGSPDYDGGSGRYRFSEGNPLGLRMITFDRMTVEFVYEDAGRDCKISFDFTQPVHSQGVFVKDLLLHLQEVVCYAAWQDSSCLELTLYYIETPYVVTYTFGFVEEALDVGVRQNVSLNGGGVRDIQMRGLLRQVD